MNKEHQIEQMAKIVDEMYNVYTTTAEDIAEGLYNAGYRKIDDDCAVITKAELKEYKRQAVKEFAEKLKEKFEGYEATCYNGVEEGWHDLKEEIDDLLKEYER